MKILYYLLIFLLCNSLYAFDSDVKSRNLEAGDFELTQQEQQWLKEHSKIRVASDNAFPPIEWLAENNHYQGIAIDYLKIIEQKLPIKFIQVRKDSWTDILQGIQENKIDLLAAIAKNKNREQYLLFTKPYLSFPAVIISSHQYQHLDELEGKKVGVVKDSYWDDLLTQGTFNIQIVHVDNGELGVELASIGVIDAMVSNLATVSYAIRKMGIGNLNIVHVPRHEHRRLELSFSVRKDWPELQSILQKTINSISQNKKDKIYNRWVKLQPIAFWQNSQFWLLLAAISLILFIIVSSILVWNRTLKNKVKERTVALENAQKQLIHAEKMESIGRLSAGVAHEVKNPLAILQMSIDYLKGEENDATIKTILTDMEDAIERADTVIKGLLDFSREKELQMSAEDLNEVIKNSIHLIEHEIKQHNIHLITQLENELPLILMDRNRLQQVFINLFINAIHAMVSSKKQGKEILELEVISRILLVTDPDLINIEMNNNELQFDHDQKLIQIIIRDTGTGLDKQHEQAVFEPFFTTKAQGEGTGLGLSVSKTIIGLHHGMIHMQNRFDGIEGVEVMIIFPVLNEKGKANSVKKGGEKND